MLVLCVKKSDMEMSVDLQKDNLVDVLTGAKYFEEKEIPEDYVPLDFAITIRSTYTNKVVLCTHSDSNSERCFFNLTNIPYVIHKGFDLVMFISSIAVMKMCDQTKAPLVANVMMKSKFDIIGLLNLDPEVFNPIVYSHVILEDDTVEVFESLLAEGFRIVPISDLPEHENFRAFKESLILCKNEGGTKDE